MDYRVKGLQDYRVAPRPSGRGAYSTACNYYGSVPSNTTIVDTTPITSCIYGDVDKAADIANNYLSLPVPYTLQYIRVFISFLSSLHLQDP